MSNTAIRTFGLAALALAATQVSACATILRTDSQKFTIESSPPGAEAKTSLGVTCTTPCTFKAKRKDRFSVTVSKDGYEPVTTEIGRKLAGGGGTTTFLGNAIAGGAIGVGVDFATGAPYDLYPNPLVVELKPVGAAPAPVAETTPAPAAEAAPTASE
ncbi:MAG: PEGA domain-containing protein [Caulobacter sp.]|nr:PEGA domain-containing protein [Caulobacter sp.]